MANCTPTNGQNGTPAKPPTTRDPRVDSAISWALTMAATLAFAVGAFQFQALASEVRALRADLATINVRTSVIEAARYGEALKDLDQRVRALERERSTSR